MEFEPSPDQVELLIQDFARDFGRALPYEDAQRILALYAELCELFDKHSGGGPILPHLVLER